MQTRDFYRLRVQFQKSTFYFCYMTKRQLKYVILLAYQTKNNHQKAMAQISRNLLKTHCHCHDVRVMNRQPLLCGRS